MTDEPTNEHERRHLAKKTFVTMARRECRRGSKLEHQSPFKYQKDGHRIIFQTAVLRRAVGLRTAAQITTLTKNPAA
jgi:hypothetical protein